MLPNIIYTKVISLQQTEKQTDSASSVYYGLSAGIAHLSESKGGVEILLGLRRYSDYKEYKDKWSIGIHLGGAILF
jgi:hypothetical protein